MKNGPHVNLESVKSTAHSQYFFKVPMHVPHHVPQERDQGRTVMTSFPERERVPKKPMRIIPLFLLTHLYLLNEVLITESTKIRRCCSPGEALSTDGDVFACIPAPYDTLELYELDPFSRGLPTCSPSENLRSTPLASAPLDISADACLDVLYRTNQSSFLAVLNCASENPNYKEESMIIHQPTVLPLRRCCSSGEVFSTSSRACVPASQEVPVTSLVAGLGILEYVTLLRGPPECPHAIMDYEVNVTDINFHSGQLQVSVPMANKAKSFWVNQENSCVDSNPRKDLLTIRVCREPEFCQDHPCLRKCCSEDEAFVNGICQPLPSHMTVHKLHEEISKISTMTANRSEDVLRATDYGLLIGNPCLDGMYPVEKHDNWHITSEGYLFVPGYKTYEHQEFCFDLLYNRSGTQDAFYPFVCFDPLPVNDVLNTRYYVNMVLMMTSCTFLLITLLVYVCLPGLQNLHGKTLMCYVSSLLVAFLCLVFTTLSTPRSSPEDEQEFGLKWNLNCVTLGYVMLFAFLSTFSWLNVMCFDIWWTFGGASGAANRAAKGDGQRKRFLCYCLYAWGLPLLICSLGYLLDQYDSINPYFRPYIGKKSCWFHNESIYHGEFIYFTAPTMIQLIINIVFFALTARSCNRVKSEIQRVMANPSDSRNRRFRADKTRLLMNVKLFIVMGVTWMFEFISNILNHYAYLIIDWNYIFYASDCLNCLQGVLIFILFVLKRQVYHALRRRFGLVKNAKASTTGIHDPFRVKKSASSSTIMSTCVTSSSP
ncbi:G-protein coupled receptor Mth2 [Cephus cinctus]|uniref:G-protein coupled receptor Mth2 n=1 Tax=Cephus cinctus TaxID=211228 RepID=A0AAJ7FVF9_CEPCN|nr:G-protein coupled receptor Mth2 [Cephus cinctus]